MFVQSASGDYVQEIMSEDLEIEDGEVTAAELSDVVGKEIHRVFDLTCDYPIRAKLYKDGASGTRYLLLTIHHIAFDEWSINILLREFEVFYKARSIGQAPQLPPLKIEYCDFAVWQREYLSKRMPELVTYWREYLAGYETISFPSDYTRPTRIDYRGGVHRFELSEGLTRQLYALSESLGVTLYTVLLGGFGLLLSCYTGQDDLLIGTPVANRQHPDLAHLIGFFVNTLVLRLRIDGDLDLAGYLRQLQERVIEAQWHQDLPFEKLIDSLGIERDISRHPLFQILFTVQYDLGVVSSEYLEVVDFKEQPYQVAKFDLSLNIQASKNGIRGGFTYASALFKESSIARLSGHYIQLLTVMLEQAQAPIRTYSVLTKDEYALMVHTWNKTTRDYPRDKTIDELFRDQVLKSPDAIALMYEGETLCYGDLDKLSNQLASTIKAHYQDEDLRDRLIGLCVSRSMDM
ncbi:MAG: condensation domain-containing protein, partial [Burkholderiaceae bacterium]|nr:condensation domain-containing protein [Burkholderiaceae bacterium]